jgi:hypothetical protein
MMTFNQRGGDVAPRASAARVVTRRRPPSSWKRNAPFSEPSCSNQTSSVPTLRRCRRSSSTKNPRASLGRDASPRPSRRGHRRDHRRRRAPATRALRGRRRPYLPRRAARRRHRRDADRLVCPPDPSGRRQTRSFRPRPAPHRRHQQRSAGRLALRRCTDDLDRRHRARELPDGCIGEAARHRPRDVSRPDIRAAGGDRRGAPIHGWRGAGSAARRS